MYDYFIERLETALEHDEWREDFLDYLQGLTREQRAELLAEADRREHETRLCLKSPADLSRLSPRVLDVASLLRLRQQRLDALPQAVGEDRVGHQTTPSSEPTLQLMLFGFSAF